jgi:hypothetical protein
MCKALRICAALLSAAAMSTAAVAQPLNTSPGTYSTQGGITDGPGGDQVTETYGNQTIVRGPRDHDRIYSTYGVSPQRTLACVCEDEPARRAEPE